MHFNRIIAALFLMGSATIYAAPVPEADAEPEPVAAPDHYCKEVKGHFVLC